jgi:hypothetical protein
MRTRSLSLAGAQCVYGQIHRNGSAISVRRDCVGHENQTAQPATLVAAVDSPDQHHCLVSIVHQPHGKNDEWDTPLEGVPFQLIASQPAHYLKAV